MTGNAMHIEITDASFADASIIAEFNQQMAQETENKTLDTATINAGVERMITDSSLGRYLVAREETGRIVGCLGITYEWSDWRNGLFWWIQSVYVLPEARENGVFTAMYQQVRDLCQATDNACGIRLYVERDNDRAYRTYVRLGMVETEYRLMEEEFGE
ncbi:MAG: GNAT family N-acetyltransferase [Gammaproteobacteria bacterium]|jgi:ribosomal protein S18 acetylase RimI-like enzyme